MASSIRGTIASTAFSLTAGVAAYTTDRSAAIGDREDGVND